MKLLLLLVAATPALAQDAPPATSAPATSAPAQTPAAPIFAHDAPRPTNASAQSAAPFSTARASNAPSFLASRGALSGDELVDVLGVNLTKKQREQLDEALAKRNATLAKANDELSATLRALLQTSDEGLAKRADESVESKRMERMKRLQPSRYRELMNRKKAENPR